MIGKASEIRTAYCEEYGVWNGQATVIKPLDKVINERLVSLGNVEILSITHRVDAIGIRDHPNALIIYKEESTHENV